MVLLSVGERCSFVREGTRLFVSFLGRGSREKWDKYLWSWRSPNRVNRSPKLSSETELNPPPPPVVFLTLLQKSCGLRS